MKNIVITGGAGYIGRHIAECFINNGYFVIIIDNYSVGIKDNTLKNCIWLEVDLLDEYALNEIFLNYKISSCSLCWKIRDCRIVF